MNTNAASSWTRRDNVLLNLGSEANGSFDKSPATVGDVGVFNHAAGAYVNGVRHGSFNQFPSTYVSVAQQSHSPGFQRPAEHNICDDDVLMPDIDVFLIDAIDQQDDLLTQLTFDDCPVPGPTPPGLWLSEPQNIFSHTKRSRPASSASHETGSSKRGKKAVAKKPAFTQFQTGVLEDWLSRNLADPFPSAKTKASLADSTGLSIRQVERWFARTRQRKLVRLTLDQAGSVCGEDVMAIDQVSPRQGPGLRHYLLLEHTSNHNDIRMLGTACHSLTGTRTDKARSLDGFTKRRSLLRDVRALRPTWCEASTSAASLKRPNSCPPPSNLVGLLNLFLSRSCGAQSATNGKYSLQVGLPSHPGSHWSIPKSNSRNSSHGETPHVEPMLYLQDWGIERWLELLPTEPGGFDILDVNEPTRELSPEREAAEVSGEKRAPTGCGDCDAPMGLVSPEPADPVTSLDAHGRCAELVGWDKLPLLESSVAHNRDAEAGASFTLSEQLHHGDIGSKHHGGIASSHAPPSLYKARPHVCSTCMRSFARIEHLKRHERSHSKEKPFHCPDCRRSFARRDLLLRHQQKLHSSTTPAAQPSLGRRKSVGAVNRSQQQRNLGESAGATLRRSASTQNFSPYPAASPPPSFPLMSPQPLWSNPGIGVQPYQSLGTEDQGFSWLNSATSTQHEVGSPYHYAQSYGGSSGAASVASCSSYMAFGPRKGRRVAYGGTSPGVASTSPPTDAWDWVRPSTPSKTPAFDLSGHPLVTPDTQPAFDAAAYYSCHEKALADVFPDYNVPVDTDTYEPGDAECPEVSAANAHVQSSGDSAFQCTFCGRAFNKKYAWQRHEEALHAPPRVWVCEPSAFLYGEIISDGCPFCWPSPHLTLCYHHSEECWERPEKDRTYFRKDAFVQHLRLMHQYFHPVRRVETYSGREVDVPSAHLICPFCDTANATWQERVEHVAEHFKKGERLPNSRWNRTENQQ
ncbi:hypothetical protein PV04_04988 [Phialophora macrospora]|uniref:Homeobox domain-containing protein n=1 Tax=Phialophora macrospora TaxID=1851006 RepID=A0A0D2FLX4_9EURO|nr:hypothetical protein PV04_04988 [Phialophora macrospora]